MNTQPERQQAYPPDMVIAFLVFLGCLIYSLSEQQEWWFGMASHP